jgi:hypothetical protein
MAIDSALSRLQRLAVYQLRTLLSPMYCIAMKWMPSMTLRSKIVQMLGGPAKTRGALRARSVSDLLLWQYQFFGQDFDHNRAAKFGVNRFIDRSLPARTELLENLVIP